MACLHKSVHCINEYELIRKYRCNDCNGVMMCSCDREIGERFLPHQLDRGCVLETQARVPVTLGFVDGICRECRGLAPEAHPMAAIPGRTSKIRRYYWRELAFRTFEKFALRAEAAGLDPRKLHSSEAQDLRGEVEREVLEEIKQFHTNSQKYDFREPSQTEVFTDYEVEVVQLTASFAPKTQKKGVSILDGEDSVSAEEFVCRHFRAEGWDVLFCESRPFHVLFGLYMWLLIQDPADPLCEMRGFAAKMDLPSYSLAKGETVWTLLPTDFGTTGYAERRAKAIDEHFESIIPPDRTELLWLFDYWLEGSALLRDYLWADDPADVARARRLVEILPPEIITRILLYLIGDYWRHYTGWPDLLVFRGSEFFLAEVKASKDKLSGDQKRWIGDNSRHLKLPFKLVKVTRSPKASRGSSRAFGQPP